MPEPKSGQAAVHPTVRPGPIHPTMRVRPPHGGELVVQRMPTQEEAALYKIEHRRDEDGASRIRATAIPARAAVEGGEE
jgi:hypothetical protein